RLLRWLDLACIPQSRCSAAAVADCERMKTVMMTIDVNPSTDPKNTDSLRYIAYANEATTHLEIGGKAGALAALEMASMPIPEWFVVSPTALMASLSQAQQAALEAACARYESAAVDTLLATVGLAEQVHDE